MLTPRHILSCFCLVLSFNAASAQRADGGLFGSEDVLELTLSGNMRELMQHRDADIESEYQPMKITYSDQGIPLTVPLKVRTRGHFRLAKENCNYPPLLLNFSRGNATITSSVFGGLNKVKLVTPCRGEKYVVYEYLVYKLYNLVTEKSLRARLAKVIFRDTVKNKSTEPLFGILLEEDEEMAKRHNYIVVEKKSVRPENTNREDFLKMAVFEYLIGNTDWSVQYLQNVKLVAPDSLNSPTAVAYDFDHAGIVRAPYAQPAFELNLQSTLTRRYRGYCMEDISAFKEVFSLFNELKDKVYDVYRNCPMLEQSYIKATVKFLDDFYRTINDPKLSRDEFLYPCDKSGTGNVVIRGLRKD